MSNNDYTKQCLKDSAEFLLEIVGEIDSQIVGADIAEDALYSVYELLEKVNNMAIKLATITEKINCECEEEEGDKISFVIDIIEVVTNKIEEILDYVEDYEEANY